MKLINMNSNTETNSKRRSRPHAHNQNRGLQVLTSFGRMLLRGKNIVFTSMALTYLSTLVILINRQQLAIGADEVSESESNKGILLLRSSREKSKSKRVTSGGGNAIKCTFCENLNKPDLVVPHTGGKTCGSIKLMANEEVNESDVCAIIQQKERVCCPVLPGEKNQNLPYSPPTTIFVISLQGTPGAHESNNGRLDLFKEKWRNACGSSTASSTHIEQCPTPFDTRRGYGLTQAWILCLWRARQLDEEAIIFLEDDARLFENSTQEFCDVKRRGELLSKLPRDTLLAFLGGHTWSYEDSAVPYRRLRNSYGTYGFVVPRGSIEDFHAALSYGLLHGSKDRKQNVHHNSLDPEANFYRAAREYHKRIYAFNPLVVWHEGGYSNTWGKVRGNITGLETKNQGIKVSSGMSNTSQRSMPKMNAGADFSSKLKTTQIGVVQQQESKCTFCQDEVVNFNRDMVVPHTGGNTCDSIKLMAAGEVNGSDVCATLQKEESVCCPDSNNIEPEALSLLDQQSADFDRFTEGDSLTYLIRNEPHLAEIVGIVREKKAFILKYYKPITGMGSEETVVYRPDVVQSNSEALLARTGTFSNCTWNMENSHSIWGAANDRSATVSCRIIRFSAEASSFVGKSGTIIVGVLSVPKNFGWRESIRTTWAATNNTAVFFVLAGPWNDIKEEYNMYKDIIWIDMEESFRLITYKTSMFFQVVNIMAFKLNLSYSHVLKTDDDSYVALGRLEQFVKREQPKHLDYWGYSDMKYVKPLRNPKHRYYESLDQYPEPYYPPYVNGAAILLSRQTVECVTRTMQDARFLDLEDVFVGIVVARCGAIPSHSDLVRVYRGSIRVTRWTANENNMQEVTMKNKIIQHRILSPEEMISHHESMKTVK